MSATCSNPPGEQPAAVNSARALRQSDRPIPPGPSTSPYDLVLLDRDGTLNERVPGDYVRSAHQLRMLPGAVEAVAQVVELGARVVLVTNQQGIARGLMSWEALDEVHEALLGALRAGGGQLHGIEVCPHLAGTCPCRKPAVGLFTNALRRASWARPARCLVVGDMVSDTTPGRMLGMSTILLRGSATDGPDRADNLVSALGRAVRSSS